MRDLKPLRFPISSGLRSYIVYYLELPQPYNGSHVVKGVEDARYTNYLMISWFQPKLYH